MYKLTKMAFIAGSFLSLLINTVIADTTEIPNTKHREIQDASQYPWSAIGKVNWAGISQRAHCTGALIAEDLVVTASHCLINQRTDKKIAPELIHFSAGYQKGESIAHTTAIKIFRDESFSLNDGISTEVIRKDWAILQLKEPIGRKVGYLGWVVFNPKALKTILNPKGKVMSAGYPRDRQHVLSLDFKCKLSMDAQDDQLIRHTCKTVEGDSGGPLAILYKGHATLIGINSSTSTNNVNRAVTLKSAQKHLQKLLNASKPINKKAAINFTKGRPPEEAIQ